MLQEVEVLPRLRRHVRRAVQLECQLLSELWDEPVPHVVTEISPEAVWVQTPYPLQVDDDVLVQLTPPRGSTEQDLVAIGRVRRVEMNRRRGDPLASGMAITFEPFDDSLSTDLSESLQGIPPPLPPDGTPRVRDREMMDIERLDA